MSKSEDSPQGTILVLDPPKTIEKKIKSAVTDSGAEVRHDREDKPGVSNLIEIYGAVTGHIDRRRRDASSTASSTACSRSRSPKRSSSSCDRCRSVTRSSRPIPPRSTAGSRVGADAAEAIAEPVLARASRAAGLLPRPRLTTRIAARLRLLPGRGFGRSAGQSYLPLSSPRSWPASSSRLTVPPPDAPWITTACGLHQSTLTPTPMPAAARSDSRHLRVATRRLVLRVEVAPRLRRGRGRRSPWRRRRGRSRSSRSRCPRRRPGVATAQAVHVPRPTTNERRGTPPGR